ncbi:ECF transporter S component [Tissierella sp. P1]|uniref:ECF transporter S component n=1 Tax=Tissierella sp. P1 TaxID=1280483 RepID=UPI000BA12654|nr:ECF transporter S component [Tissierella sp. P1]OZV11469.1 ECF transporter S component [Tissierella sp. P1]
MKNKMIKSLVLSGVFIATGLVLPMAFHAIGGAGPVFLPMHIPVLIAGFFLELPFAAAVGILTPLLSSLLTGMPPFFPVLPYMILELATYGAIVSLLYRKSKVNVCMSLIISMICGRIMAGAAVWVLATIFMVQLPSPVVFVQGAIIKGIPGIIIQLILIPSIVLGVKRFNPTSEFHKLT